MIKQYINEQLDRPKLEDRQIKNLNMWLNFLENNEFFGEGNLIQIDPKHSPNFGGHFVVVKEFLPYAIKGYIQHLKFKFSTHDIKVNYIDCVPVGSAFWVK